MQPQIHLIDETWINAPVPTVSAVVADPAGWPRWWPGLELTVTRDRGLKGIQWSARSVQPGSPNQSAQPGRPGRGRLGILRAGAHRGRWHAPVGGTVEIWLEPHRAGVIVHHYLRLDPLDGSPLGRRVAAARTRSLAEHAKQVFWQLKDELEGRPR